MKRYRIRLKGQTFDVRIVSDPRAGEVQVEVNGEPIAVTVETVPEVREGQAAAAQSEAARVPLPSSVIGAPTRASELVTAPLPGVIKSIAVRPGEEVSPGQVLLVIEAMKMDNLLRASRAAVVKEIHVAPGSQVAHGERLLSYKET
jgi:biotin carboxyl carrier protein